MATGDNNRKLSDADRAEIVRLYTTPQEDGTWMGVKLIARRFGVAHNCVQYHLKRANVKTRTSKEAYANGKRVKPITHLPVGTPPNCKCGCGRKTEWHRHKNRWRIYVEGHFLMRGKDHPAWIDGRSYRGYPADWPEIATEIRRRDDWTCRDCDTAFPKRSGRLAVHHIDRNTLNSDAANLVTLCQRCHMKRHRVEGHL